MPRVSRHEACHNAETKIKNPKIPRSYRKRGGNKPNVQKWSLSWLPSLFSSAQNNLISTEGDSVTTRESSEHGKRKRKCTDNFFRRAFITISTSPTTATKSSSTASTSPSVSTSASTSSKSSASSSSQRRPHPGSSVCEPGGSLRLLVLRQRTNKRQERQKKALGF